MSGDAFHPRAVLGIDAAWTDQEPSGVALAVETASGWRLAAVEASYGHVIDCANGVVPGEPRPTGAKPNASALLDAATKICGRRVDLVAVDMPMARRRITERRPADQRISKKYGAKGAATHSPSAERPGKISDALRKEFETLKAQPRIRLGFPFEQAMGTAARMTARSLSSYALRRHPRSARAGGGRAESTPPANFPRAPDRR